MPRRTKNRTQAQAASAQKKAVNFLQNVVGDAAKADEIEALTVGEYAARKGFVLTNPLGRRHKIMTDTSYSSWSKRELIEALSESDERVLELENFLESGISLLEEDPDDEENSDGENGEEE